MLNSTSQHISIEWSGRVCVGCNNKLAFLFSWYNSIPEQVSPLPMKPTLHSHLKEPSMFMHSPSSWQLWVFSWHSSISWKKQNMKSKRGYNLTACSQELSCPASTGKKEKSIKGKYDTYTGYSISCVNRDTCADERSVSICTASIHMTVMLVIQFTGLTFVDIWKTQNILSFYLISELLKQDENRRHFECVDEARASLGSKELCVSTMVRWYRFRVGCPPGKVSAKTRWLRKQKVICHHTLVSSKQPER